MMILLSLFAGLILTLVVPAFFTRSREEHWRVAGMLFGGYISLIGLSGAALVLYVAIVDGAVGIGRRGKHASFTFSDDPVAATLTLLVTLACTATFTAFGWSLFKSARDRTLEL